MDAIDPSKFIAMRSEDLIIMGQSRLPKESAESGTILQHIALVLLLVIGVASWFVSSFGQVACGSDEQRAKIDLRGFHSQIQIYALDMESIPSNEQGLTALVKPPVSSRHAERWKGPYTDGGLLSVDPWGHAYSYRVSRVDEESREVTLRSLGADGKANTQDDITKRFTTKLTIDDEGRLIYTFVSDRHGC